MAVLRTGASFKDSVVIVAFPGLGYIGTVVGRYLVDKLNLRWSGHLYSDSLPPVGRVRKGKLLHPINVFSGKGFHVILSEVSIPEGEVWSLANAILTKARKDGAKMIIVLSGVLIEDTTPVYGIPSNSIAASYMEKLGIKPIENGVISGVSAALLLLSKDLNFPTLLLLGPASSINDFTASVKVLKTIGSVLSLDVPTDELEELVHHYQEEIRMMRMKKEEPIAPMYG